MTPMPAIPPEIEARLKAHIAGIARLFKAPRITLIVRAPEGANVKGDLILTADNLTLVMQSLRAMMVREAQILVGTPEEMTLIEKPRTDARPNFQSDNLDARTRPSKRG